MAKDKWIPRAQVDTLVTYVLDGNQHPCYEEVLHWSLQNQRFASFLSRYQNKVRKKFRTSSSPGAMQDVLAELAIAYSLLREPKFDPGYEFYASEKSRGPDFKVLFKDHLAFNIEVTRLHDLPQDNGQDRLAAVQKRIHAVIAVKMGQLTPGLPNLLALVAPAFKLPEPDFERIMATFVQLVQGKDPILIAKSSVANPIELNRLFLRLSGLFLFGDGTVYLWENRQARSRLDSRVIPALRHCFRGEEIENRAP